MDKHRNSLEGLLGDLNIQSHHQQNTPIDIASVLADFDMVDEQVFMEKIKDHSQHSDDEKKWIGAVAMYYMKKKDTAEAVQIAVASFLGLSHEDLQKTTSLMSAIMGYLGSHQKVHHTLCEGRSLSDFLPVEKSAEYYPLLALCFLSDILNS